MSKANLFADGMATGLDFAVAQERIRRLESQQKIDHAVIADFMAGSRSAIDECDRKGELVQQLTARVAELEAENASLRIDIGEEKGCYAFAKNAAAKHFERVAELEAACRAALALRLHTVGLVVDVYGGSADTDPLVQQLRTALAAGGKPSE